MTPTPKAEVRPWIRRTVTLTADGYEPFTHVSKSQATDPEGAYSLVELLRWNVDQKEYVT